jgi:hypothetical protein
MVTKNRSLLLPPRSPTPIKKSVTKAEIVPPVTFHIPRHTHGSLLAMNVTPIGVIAAQLGHADTRMSSHTNVDVTRDRFGSSGTASTKFCKLNVIASTNGMVTKLATEDGSVGRTEAIGNFDIHGSVCAHYMGIRKG